MILIGFVSLPFGFLCLWPLTRRILLTGKDDGLLALLAGFGASVGGLTLWMLALGLLPGARLAWWTSLIFPAAMWVMGLWGTSSGYEAEKRIDAGPQPLSRSGLTNPLGAGIGKFSFANFVAAVSNRLPARDGWTWVKLSVLGALAVVAIHAFYYPFIGDDELARYALYARQVYTTSNISSDIQGYPLLMTLGYVYAFQTTGGLNESLAKALPVAFAAGTTAAAFEMGRRIGGSRLGWLTAALTALTPMFAKWAPHGYTDLATGFYFVLTFILTREWVTMRNLAYAALAGAMVGFALWTKQAAFALAPSVALVWLWAALADIRSGNAGWLRRALAGAAAFAVPAVAIGLPWYLRNLWLGADSIAPSVSLTELAATRHEGWLVWLPFFEWLEDFGWWLAPVFVVGLAFAIWNLIKPLTAARSDWALTFAFFLPYFLIWRALYTIDSRYLLTVLPLYALMGAAVIAFLFDKLSWRPPAAAVAVLMGALWFGGVRAELGAVYQAVTQPFATYDERLLRSKADVYSVVLYIRQNIPPDSRLLVQDARLPYYLPEYTVTTGYPTTVAALKDYDYFIFAAWSNKVYPRIGAADNELMKSLDDPARFEYLFQGSNGMQTVYRVMH